MTYMANVMWFAVSSMSSVWYEPSVAVLTILSVPSSFHTSSMYYIHYTMIMRCAKRVWRNEARVEMYL